MGHQFQCKYICEIWSVNPFFFQNRMFCQYAIWIFCLQWANTVLDYKCQLANTVIGFIWYFFFLPTIHCMHCFVNQPTHSSGNSVLLLPAFHYRLLLPFLFVGKLIDYLSLFFCCVRIIDLCVSKLIDYYYKYLLTIYIIKRLIFPLP